MSILNLRIKIYEDLIKQQGGDLPTIKELSKAFMSSLNTVRVYKTRCNRIGAYNFKTRSCASPGVVRLGKTIDAIYARHGFLPTISELAKMFGVSRQAIHQEVHRGGFNVRSGGVLFDKELIAHD